MCVCMHVCMCVCVHLQLAAMELSSSLAQARVYHDAGHVSSLFHANVKFAEPQTQLDASQASSSNQALNVCPTTHLFT